MQKLQTDKLYIVGLFIISGTSYEDERLILSRKFLKWIVVENESTSYTACFKDIKTDVNYFSSGNFVGDLFIDMDTLFSFNNMTNKIKLSKEEIALYLKEFKDNYNMTKIRTRKITYQVLSKLIKEFGNETSLIIDKVMSEFDLETPENMKMFLSDISESLDLAEDKPAKTRNRKE